MRKSPFILLLLVIPFFLVSCKKKDKNSSNENKIGSFSFTQNELKIVPYPTGDTLVFKSPTENSVILIFLGRSTHMEQCFENPQLPVGSRGDYYDYECNCTGFKTPDSCLTSILMTCVNPSQMHGEYKIVSFSLYIDTSLQCNFHCPCRFNQDTLLNYYDSSLLTLGYVKAFHYNITLGSKLFNSVYELIGESREHFCSEFLSTLFYSFHDGIVGFQTNTGKLWYLSSVN